MTETNGGDPASNVIYLRTMRPELAELFVDAPTDLSLETEIKLLRACIAHLLDDSKLDHPNIMRITTALARLVDEQSKLTDGVSDVEQALLDAADDQLGEME